MRMVTDSLVYPEGPVAMADGSVILVDIADEKLKRVSPDGDVSVIAAVPGGPNGAALGPDGRVYICNHGGVDWIEVQDGRLRTGFQSAGYRGGGIDAVDLGTGRVERLYERCGAYPLRGPNDLVFDGSGGFWFTDMGKRRQREMDLGAVYWACADGSEIREVISGMISPNGIALSPDGKHSTWPRRIRAASGHGTWKDRDGFARLRGPRRRAECCSRAPAAWRVSTVWR